MISYQEALKRLLHEASARRLGSEAIQPSEMQIGRILSESVISEESIPEFDNSAVDGFALRSADLVPGRQRLPVKGRFLPGECPKTALAGTAVEIMTGAPVPLGGFDLLIKVEDVIQIRAAAGNGGCEIDFDAADASPVHLRKCGTDYRAGDRVAEAGWPLEGAMLLALGTLGIREVTVFRKPRVWVISTGNELVDAFSEKREPGQIRNSTGPFLVAELMRLGCEVRGPIPVSDEVTSGASGLETVLRSALAEHVDLVLSTGAVSMGVHDIVKEGVVQSGGLIGFHQVAQRPGKPVLFATFPDAPQTLFFGLPGNPVSTAVGLEFFVKPCLRAMRGQQEPAPIRAVLSAPAKKPAAFRGFLKAFWRVDTQGMSRVEILPGQASFMVHSLGRANAWAILPEGEETVPAGAVIEVVPFL